MNPRPASRPSLADPLPVRAPGLCIGTVVSGSAALLWIAQAALLAAAVQRLAQGDGLQAVILPALGYALLGLARASAEAWGTRRVFRAARQSLTRQRALAAAALASRSPLDPGRPASGQAASVLAEQADALLPWLSRYQPTRWRVMLVPPVIAAVVAWQSWLAALILLLAAPLIPLTMAFVGWRAKAASEQHLQALGGMNAFLLDRLRGLSTLRVLRAVGLTAQRLRTSAEDLRERTMRVLRIAFLSSAALELFSALAVALVAVYVGFHLLGEIGTGAWGQRLTLGEGLFVLLLAPAFFEPLRELSAVWHDRAAGQAAQEALGALQDPALPLPGALDAADLEPPEVAAAPALHLKGVGFAHAGQAPVLEDLHLHIGAGEHVALVGPSGCGKTTLLSLLAGLVPATAGEVWIGHQRLDVQNAPALRRRIAWIGQQPHVFSASLHDNVALGRPGMDVQRVAAALQQSALGPLAPQRSLGEGGAGLSGGERVRLALARAAASPSADLWLVDEPTAHLDSETASAITQSLLQLARGRTLIVATHDLALAARIGRVIHLDATYTLRRAA